MSHPPLRAGLRTGLGAALSLAVGAGLALAPTTPAIARTTTFPVPPGTTQITVAGQGYGHGHGMSQWGARAAAEAGLAHEQILKHYYPGTGLGQAGGRMRVLITDDTSRDVLVVTRPGLRAKVVGKKRVWQLTKLRKRAARTAKRWRITPLAGGRSALAYKNRGWHRLATVGGSLEFTAGGRPIELVLPGGSRAAYRGVLRSAVPGGGLDRDTVNLVGLEGYLKGVVASEMPASWHPEAVQAQAVAARSYAAYERAHDSHGYFDVYDTTADQVYDGLRTEHPASSAAIDATRAQVVTYGGRPAFTQFSASNGGWMLANSTAPYLVSGQDPYVHAQDTNMGWKKQVRVSAFEARWPSAGRILSLTIETYPNAGPWVERVRIDGEKADFAISGSDFRSWAGLKSASFLFE